MGQESKKSGFVYIYIYIYIYMNKLFTLQYCSDQHNIADQLYSNKNWGKKKEREREQEEAGIELAASDVCCPTSKGYPR